MPTKLILDTDIGTDVDDAWALALCLASREIDLVGVTLVYGDLDVRSRIALKMLHLAGRADVPVFKGLSTPMTDGVDIYWAGHEGSDTDFSDISGLSARDGAVEFILDTVSEHPGEVAICSIGPLTNIAEAIRRNPEAMRRVKGPVMMASSYEGEGVEAAAWEHNGCCDPAATRIVFESQIPAVVVGLNVTRQVSVRREQLGALEGSPFGDYLAAMTYQYLDIPRRDFTCMHDPLAVSTLIDPSLVNTRRTSAGVLDDGRVAFSSDARGWLDVCVGVDAGRFEKMLAERVTAIDCL